VTPQQTTPADDPWRAPTEKQLKRLRASFRRLVDLAGSEEAALEAAAKVLAEAGEDPEAARGMLEAALRGAPFVDRDAISRVIDAVDEARGRLMERKWQEEAERLKQREGAEQRAAAQQGQAQPAGPAPAEAPQAAAAAEERGGEGGRQPRPMTEKQRELIDRLWQRLVKRAERAGKEDAEDRALDALAAQILKMGGYGVSTEALEAAKERVQRVLAGEATVEEASAVIDALKALL
jgi:hypothetical protein